MSEVSVPVKIMEGHTPQASLLEVINKAALNPQVDIEKMKALLDMHERITQREAEIAFNEAMSSAQAEMRRVVADKPNKQTDSMYASYGALDRMVRPIYTKFGISLSFNTGESASPDVVMMLCSVSRGGFTKEYRLPMPADGKGPKGGDVMSRTHATGSATQYGMRYLLKMIFNLAIGNDDDGNSAGATAITPEQVDELRALLHETKSSIPFFLKAHGVETLEAIPASKYAEQIRTLQQKKAKIGA